MHVPGGRCAPKDPPLQLGGLRFPRPPKKVGGVPEWTGGMRNPHEGGDYPTLQSILVLPEADFWGTWGAEPPSQKRGVRGGGRSLPGKTVPIH